jgi:hypothetical protein
LVQLALTTVHALGLIVFRTAAQMVLITALGLGVCFIPEVNAHVPQTKEFSATAASLVELVAREWGIRLFTGRAQAVLVTSNPDGAIVHLGGRTVGKTPLTLRIAPGTVTITFSRPGYGPVTRTLTVKLGKAAVLQVTLTAAPVQSTVNTQQQTQPPSGHQPQDPAERNLKQGDGTKPGD